MATTPRSAARVQWSSDTGPGITRGRAGRGFVYRNAVGRPPGRADAKRIANLVIPPAWTDVWISPSPTAHIQATGRDARGRKQYIYHPAWRAKRDEAKFARMLAFGRALPRIRRRVDHDLRRRGPAQERVLAAAVRMLEHHPIRAGNDYYARTNGTFGLTTLRSRHVHLNGDHLRLQFVGKSGKQHIVEFSDPRLGRAIRACEELPGQALFQYSNGDGEVRRIHSDDLNEYIRDCSGGDFTVKDFRTWSASVLATRLFADADPEDHHGAVERRVVREVAGWLGNTVAVCRQCYIHPAVFGAFKDGTLQRLNAQRHSAWSRGRREPSELLFLALLETSCKQTATASTRSADGKQLSGTRS